MIGTALSKGLFDERRVTSSFNFAGSTEPVVTAALNSAQSRPALPSL